MAGGLLVWLLGGAAACAGRVEGGVFYSSKGYRVTLPVAREWEVVEDDQADLELRARGSRSGILANATCEGKVPRRPLAILARHLLFGLRDREVLEEDEATVGGHPAHRVLLQGRLDQTPVRVEAYVVKGARCVYDLIYVAPPAVFSAGVSDFHAFVRSFTGP